MTKSLIAIDCDEVLLPLHEPFLKHHNETYGTAYAYPDPEGRYYLHQFIGEHHDVVTQKLKTYSNSPEFAKLAPLAGAIKTINHLITRFRFVGITARQDFMQEVTFATLSQNFGSAFEDIHFTPYNGKGEHSSKLQLCKELGSRFIIDDNLHTVTECAAGGMEAILFGEYHWNKTNTLPAHVTRCQDWTAVKDYFDAR